jgi:hypothetical protein
MEGTNGRVIIENENIVTKIIKRKHTGFGAEEQYKIHKIAYEIVKKNNFEIIKVPKLLKLGNKSISMEKIDDSYPYYREKSNKNSKFCNELKKFYEDFKTYGYFPYDYECYLQKDNKVYILDFDKFKLWDKTYNIDKKDFIGIFIPDIFII